MNLEELRTVQRTERQKDSLQHLRESFYRDVADYVADLKAERDRAAAAADDPFSAPEVSRLTDEIETAEEVVESIYERRIGKVVKRATFAAAGMAAEEEGLTREERDLFEDLVARIETNRESVLETLSTEAADADAAETDETDATDETKAVDSVPGAADERVPPDAAEPADAPPEADDILAAAMGGEAESDRADERPDPPAGDGEATRGDARRDAADDASQAGVDPRPTTDGSGVAAERAETADATTVDSTDPTDADRTTVRITRDVGEIFGVDEREYELVSEDVVTLPTPNAEPLLERDAAERLD
ncbi:MAG: hypothetical protein ABEJ82_03805 [Haloplanus sp.]